MRIIHLTDLHSVPPRSTLYGLDPAVRLEAAIGDINLRHGDAELCLLTGDLADAAEAGTSPTVIAVSPSVPLRPYTLAAERCS